MNAPDRARATAAIPVTAVGGNADASASPCAIAGWERLTAGASERFTLPGGHFCLMERETEFLDLLRSLARAPAGTAAPR
ncbi:hypothetical protein ABXV03_10265 [Streptomyces harbinensis]|uniref:hypothetical protein n=1 Tax=Streptomyces harbinensis TaxID=1176198 RepID=UPI003394A670